MIQRSVRYQKITSSLISAQDSCVLLSRYVQMRRKHVTTILSGDRFTIVFKELLYLHTFLAIIKIQFVIMYLELQILSNAMNNNSINFIFISL